MSTWLGKSSTPPWTHHLDGSYTTTKAKHWIEVRNLIGAQRWQWRAVCNDQQVAHGFDACKETAKDAALRWVDNRLNELAYVARQEAQDATWHREQAALEHERNHCDKPEDYI